MPVSTDFAAFSAHGRWRGGVDVNEVHKEVHEEEQNRYTLGFFLFVLILVSSVTAVAIKAILFWLNQ